VAATPADISPVVASVVWLGGWDVTPHNISPAKAGAESTNVKTVAARGNLSRFIIFPLFGLCSMAELDCRRVATTRSPYIGRMIISEGQKFRKLISETQERQSSHGFSETAFASN
jgi:hypothetical protein